ncbi:MAG: PD-(D/E)XK nuclease family protein [Bacteroidales bacterium]
MNESTPFLKRLASDLISSHGEDHEDLCIILPGKRARLFLLRAWAGLAGKPVWAPKVLTMEEFVFETLSVTKADELELSLILWKICSEDVDFEITFEQFSGWVSIILRDFNDVDLFLADPAQVFVNLFEAKELQLWTPGDDHPLSLYEQQYIRFYRRLLPWYEKLTKVLSDSKMAYQGLGFRQLAESGDRLLDGWAGKSVVFAGFNAFTPAEEKIIHTLEQAGIASMRWDADSWYLEDELQEAGYFLRRWMKKYPARDFRWITRDLTSGAKEISITGVHGHRAQTRVAGDILSGITDPSPDVAVVLPDESMLMPLLNAIPPNVNAFNVTMGLPFRHTPALSWLNLNLHLFARPGRKPSGWVRVVNLIPVIRHPWFAGLISGAEMETPINYRDPAGLLDKRYYQFDEISQIFSNHYPASGDLIRSFFTPVESPSGFIRKMELALRHLLLAGGMAGRPFDRGALLESLRILKLLHQILDQCPEGEDGYVMLQYLMSRMLQPATIPFSGEPLEGVQILGLLETRNLDFEHVIILSANERIIPAARKPLSLIPSDIRKFHGLPGVQYQDAIFAYHFYHLIQRAKKIDIIYNTDLSADFTGEMSRFIRQIETELVPGNPSISCRHERLSDELSQVETSPDLTIGKDGAVYEALLAAVRTRGLSPSHLSRYIRCPLMFYFSFVANLEEPATLEETVDFRELGTLVHSALQELYNPGQQSGQHIVPGTGMPLDEPFFENALKKADGMVALQMKNLLGGGGEVTGKNLIIMEVARFMVRMFLENERQLISGHRIGILEVEKRLETELMLTIDGNAQRVRCKGFADRIDFFDGLVRITDYKTGKVELKDLKFNEVTDLFTSPGYEKAFQLMFYCWLYVREEKAFPVTAGIFTLKSPSTYFLGLPRLEGVSAEDLTAILEAFETGLKGLIAQLLDRQQPFIQTSDAEICKKCPYQPVCLTGS